MVEPSWLKVVTTTVRLFVQRRADAARRRAAGRWSKIVAAAVVVMVVIGGVISAATVMTVGPVPLPARRLSTGRRAAYSAVAVARRAAARWIVGQVTPGTVVACGPAVCRALRAAGLPARSSRTWSGRGDDVRDPAVVAVAARAWLDGHRAGRYAPVVAASFGAGHARVDVRVIAEAGARSYLSALTSDIAQRRRAGRQLLQNPHITVTGTARGELADGKVDARLLLVLAGFSDTAAVRVVAFGDAGPHASSGVPLRQMALATSGVARTPASGYPRSLLAFMTAQRPPFRPLRVRPARRLGRPVLLVTFGAPNPLGLLAPAGLRKTASG